MDNWINQKCLGSVTCMPIEEVKIGLRDINGWNLSKDFKVISSTWKMRDFVNRRIQKYFSGRGSLESVLQDNANTFANALITLILKEDLYKELDKPDKKLDGNLFAFALITGVGKNYYTQLLHN